MDRAGRTPLQYAALEGNLNEVRRLLAEGCDVDAPDAQGFVPLHFAAQEFHPEVVRLLLEGGATVDAVNAFGNTPLWTAVFNSKGRGEVISLLRASGADPLHANEAGRTPVDLARLIGSSDVAQYFADVPQ
jgi:ankyrin repeat protein